MRAALIALALAALPAAAQPQGPALSMGQGAARAPGVVVIDRDEVLRGTRLGAARLADLAAAEASLAAENREIEARLVAEEQSLADRRAGMDPDAFRAEAAEFDLRVTEIRRTQDAKAAALVTRRETLSDQFWQDVLPLLGQVMDARAAAVMLDRGAVFLSSQAVDVTQDVIGAIDAATEEAPATEAPPPADASD